MPIPPRVRAILPWLVGLALLAWLLAPYRHAAKRAELVQAFASAPWWAFLIALSGALFAFGADTLATWLVLVWARVRLRFGEVAVLRGVTYFFAIVNYSLGQAAMILVLSRHGVRAARAAGIVLFIMGINVLVLLGFAGISMAVGAQVDPLFRRVAIGVLASVPAYLAIIVWRPAALARRKLLAPLFEMGLGGHAAAFLARLPHIASMMVAHFLMMRCFGVHAPVSVAARYLPIVFAVAVMPISAQGIGTSQLVAIPFFAPYAATGRTAVIAYSLFIMAIWVPTQVVIGALCVRTEFGRSIRRAAAAPALTEAETA